MCLGQGYDKRIINIDDGGHTYIKFNIEKYNKGNYVYIIVNYNIIGKYKIKHITPIDDYCSYHFKDKVSYYKKFGLDSKCDIILVKDFYDYIKDIPLTELEKYKIYFEKNLNGNKARLNYVLKLINNDTKTNKGEKGEINIIKFLFNNNNNKDIIIKIFNIDSRIILIDPKTRKEIISLKNINKSYGYYKADIIINFIDKDIIYHISIKCNDGSPPTLLNHTNRSCDYFQNKLPHVQLKILDSIIIKRNNIKKQDINFNLIKHLLTSEELDCLINVISYFTFDGTGEYDSKCPADSILIVGNSNDIISTSEFIVCKEDIQQKEYIKSILPKLRICMRSSKGMPGKKDHEKKMELCKPWIYEQDDNGKIKLCGSLAIRYIK